jgi:aryl-alcohol dehydrogenase-like predicted oxidoreductase
MTYSDLQGLDIKLSSLGLGCLQLGGHGWGNVSEAEMVKAIHKAIDSGVTFFDTAPIYGLGRSEEVLGKTLGAKRKNVIIATKVGLVWRKDKTFAKFTDSSPANINREIDMSLRRLNTDYIDLYQIHWPDPNTPIEDTLFAMEKLKQSGKIRCIGCCNFSLELLKESLKYDGVKTLQVPYSLIERRVEQDLLPFCKEYGIGVLAYSPLARGLLTGKYDRNIEFGPDDNRSRSEDEYFHGEAFLKNLEIVEKVKVIAKRLNKTPAQIALRWLLKNPCVTAAIFGAKNALQVEENIVSSDFILPQEDMEFLSKEVV